MSRSLRMHTNTRIVFCWSAISGYMAACWKELASRPGIDLHVIAHDSDGNSGFDRSLLSGIPHQFLDEAERGNAGTVERIVCDQRPDIVVTTGWWLPAYRNLVHSSRLGSTKFIMGVDSPWRHEGQFLTRLRYGRTLRRFDHVFVTGERSWQYVIRLGIPPERISRGMYGVDVSHWSQVATHRTVSPWPRQFVFLGRYDRVKAVDVLVEGYQRYRHAVREPWQLVCCGNGPDRGLLSGVAGIQDMGFVQPENLAAVLAASGGFVLPSRFDPWPLALVEAAAAGLPIVCTDACGSAVEVVRPHYNGLIVPKNSPESLARALATLHDAGDSLAEWGQRSIALARPYSASFWADRWLHTVNRLLAQ